MYSKPSPFQDFCSYCTLNFRSRKWMCALEHVEVLFEVLSFNLKICGAQTGCFTSHQNLRCYQQEIRRLQIASKLNAWKSSYNEFTLCQARWLIGEFFSLLFLPNPSLFWSSQYRHIPNPLILIPPWLNQTWTVSWSICLPSFIFSDSPRQKS